MLPATDSSGTATVVGAGPAGLMAAEVLGAAGLRVTVFEHMPSVGRKLLLAGRGGLNITHSEPLDQFIARFAADADRLERALRTFGPSELRAWCDGLGEPTFIGTSGRVFPASFRATPLLRAWLARLAGLGVVTQTRDRWMGWGSTSSGAVDPRRAMFSRRDDNSTATTRAVASDVTVFALGGASWPRVGSDGGWVPAFRRAGVEVNELRPANCGVRVEWSRVFADRFAGVPLKNVAIGVSVDGVMVWCRGDAMITMGGLEGGPVYAQSRAIRDAIDRDGRCVIKVDLHPDLTVETLTERLTHRRPKESLAASLRRAIGLSPVAVSVLRESTANHVPSHAAPLAKLVKAVPLVVTSTMPIARAISSAGGVALSEVDDSFMLHRLPGVFVAGEMLDWEAPTGGYLLQASFSTAVVAARGALDWLRRTTPREGAPW